MTKIKWNFSAGPSMLHESVLSKAQEEFQNFAGTGCSLMELSHRSREFETILLSASLNVLNMLQLKQDEYHVLWMPGGASTQFAAVPNNLLWSPERKMGFCVTGVWSKKAHEEAKRLFPENQIEVLLSTKENQDRGGFEEPLQFDSLKGCDVVYYCDNETVNGVEFGLIPEVPENVDLVCDMSSNMLSRLFDASRFSVIIAGAQKNIGPAGVTLVIVKDELLKRRAAAGGGPPIPTMLDYETFVKNNSLYNTPPVYPIYVCKLVLDWIQSRTLPAIHEYNQEKASLLYKAIESSEGFYRCLVNPAQRSRMNVVFRIFGGATQTGPNVELEKQFVADSNNQGFSGLAGHRSVGGLRASLYNAMPIQGVEALVQFMQNFQKAHA